MSQAFLFIMIKRISQLLLILLYLQFLQLLSSTPIPSSDSINEDGGREPISRKSVKYDLVDDDNDNDNSEEMEVELTKEEKRRLFKQQSFLALKQIDARRVAVEIEEPLEPEETRKMEWLQRHAKSKKNKLKDTPNKSDVLQLTTADNLNLKQTCQGDLFKHKIRMAGCRPTVILNRFCHGSCTSFYIPKMKAKKLSATFRSCAACVPVETENVEVVLDCPDRPEGQMTRSVVQVKRCECRNVELSDEEGDDDDA